MITQRFLVFVITGPEKDATHTNVGMLIYAMRTLHAVEVHIRHSNVQWYLRMIAATNSEMTDRTISKTMHLTIAIPTTSHWSNEFISADSLWSQKHHYQIGLCSIFTLLSTTNLKLSTHRHYIPKSFSISSCGGTPLDSTTQLLVDPPLLSR
jgi:hypothetical protein